MWEPRLATAAFLAAALLTGSPAAADVSEKDLQVAAKTLGFTDPPMAGSVKVGLIYDASNAQSQSEAEAVQAIMGAGLESGAITMVPVMVPVDQLDASLGGLGVAFVMGGMSAHFDKIFEATKSKKLLSISADPACAEAGRCVMSVTSEPKVQITVNKAASESSAIAFSPAFRMMISEI